MAFKAGTRIVQFARSIVIAGVWMASVASADSGIVRSISGEEKAVNFGVVFTAQVAAYVATQQSIIAEHGSFDNWSKYPFQPHFDKDGFDFNVVKHSFSGNYYYLFYRSRAYSERSAFFWTFASSLMFEFGIETVTERPSYQDIYQTPVFGTILGMGMERASRYLHSVDTVPTTLLGYVLNPMTLLPESFCRCALMPSFGRQGEAGLIATLEF